MWWWAWIVWVSAKIDSAISRFRKVHLCSLNMQKNMWYTSKFGTSKLPLKVNSNSLSCIFKHELHTLNSCQKIWSKVHQHVDQHLFISVHRFRTIPCMGAVPKFQTRAQQLRLDGILRAHICNAFRKCTAMHCEYYRSKCKLYHTGSLRLRYIRNSKHRKPDNIIRYKKARDRLVYSKPNGLGCCWKVVNCSLAIGKQQKGGQ